MRTKNKIKNYLKIGILLFGVILFLNSCYNEENAVQEKEKNKFIKRISHTSFKEVKKKPNISKITKKLFTKDFSKSNNQNFVIDTTSVQTLETDYYTNYTFVANMNIPNENYLTNYVLTVFNDTLFYQMLVKYPIIDDGTEITYDMGNINAEPILGEMLVNQKSWSDCDGTISWSWYETEYECTLGAGCTGDICNGEWTDPYTVITWVPTCTPVPLDAILDADPSGGGGYTNGNVDDINDGEGNLVVGTTPFKGNLLPLSPCDKLKEFEDDTYIKQQLNDLKINIADNNTIKYEVAVIFTKLNTTDWGFDVLAGTPTEPNYSFNIGLGLQVDLLVHTHYKGILSIFSPYDLKTYYDLLNANAATTDLVSMLITNSGTKYAFKITDLTKFNAIAEEYFGSLESINEFSDDFFSDIKSGNDNNTNEEEFLKMMDKLDLGVSLFKANNNFSQWQELELINGVVTPKDCN